MNTLQSIVEISCAVITALGLVGLILLGLTTLYEFAASLTSCFGWVF